MAALGLHCNARPFLVAAGGPALHHGAWASLLWLLSLGTVGSRAHGVSSTGLQAPERRSPVVVARGL